MLDSGQPCGNPDPSKNELARRDDNVDEINILFQNDLARDPSIDGACSRQRHSLQSRFILAGSTCCKGVGLGRKVVPGLNCRVATPFKAIYVDGYFRSGKAKENDPIPWN